MSAPVHTSLASDARLPAFDEIPGLVHGFGRRWSGRGSEPRESTRRRTREALAGQGVLHLLKQVHGASVALAPWNEDPAADAAVAEGGGTLIGIETADCLPVLIVDPVRRRIAAAHAGWRGTLAGVVTAAVAALAARGSRAQDLRAALGPAIGPCCYEVGPEVEEAFGPARAAFFRPGPRGRAHLDVRAANLSALLESGLPTERIFEVDECTFCRADLYHSYRRDGAGAGRMISVVGFASA